MSLVTRCPACQTTFQVVRDQLRISEGWVRCGRCSQVFDATQDLHDGDSGAPVPAHTILPAVARSIPMAAPGASFGESVPGAPPAVPPPVPEPRFDAPIFDDLNAALQAFRPEGSDASVPAPKAPRVNWPAPDMLDMDGVPAPTPQPVRAPAWRQIQAPPGLMATTVAADAPWSAKAAEFAPSPDSAAPSPVEAAVDAQLQKALRRARLEAVRKRREQGSGSASSRLAPAPGTQQQESESAVAGSPAPLPPASAAVLRQASGDSGAWLMDEVEPAHERVAPRHPEAVELPDFPAALPDSPASATLSRGRGGGALRTLLLGLLTLLAAALLPTQYLRHERDALAAAHPGLRPLIAALCARTGCQVHAPRSIDAVRIDGSSFTPVSSGGHYQLRFALRNASARPVAMPAIELSLLDANERPVVRRVFQPGDFGAPAQMAARAEQPAQLGIAIRVPPEQAGAAVVGYSMLAFYP